MKHIPILCLSLMLAAPVMADPPAHAPAHGYRNKAGKHHGYTGVEWEQDYGIESGRCNMEAVLTAVGAVGGAVVGNRSAAPEHRTIATIAGAVIGGILGKEIGEAIDDGDRACMGHSLEVGAIGRAVTWTNPRTHIAHELTPVRNLPGGCREFKYRAGPQGKSVTMKGCRNADATWKLIRG